MKILSLFILLILSIEASAQCDPLTITATYVTSADAAGIDGDQICPGDSLTLEAVSINDGDITWDLEVENGEPFLPVGTGDMVYTATSSSPDDCPTSYEIHVHALDDLIVTATPDSICAGESTVFEVPEGWCEWDLGPPCFQEIITGYPVELCETSTVTGTAESILTGCFKDVSLVVVVHTLVYDGAASEDSVCLGEEVILYGVGGEGGGILDPLNPVIPDYYDWGDDIEDSVAFIPEISGWYSCTAVSIEPSCEANYGGVALTVSSTDIIIDYVDTLICIGDSVVLTSSGTDLFSWDGGIIEGEPFYPDATDTYTVIGTDSETGCTDTSSVEIVVSHDFPSVFITASESLICNGEELILTASGADEYDWTGDVVNGVPFVEDEAGIITYNVVGSYLESGCTDSATIEITVLDEVPITYLEPDSICSGDSLLIFGNFQSESGIYSDVLATEIYGCDSVILFELVVHESPMTHLELSTICEGDSLLIFDNYEMSAGIYYDTLTSEIYGCDSILTRELVVTELPIVSFEPASTDIICLNHDDIELSAEPIGGSFSGLGVTGTIFNPAGAGEGSHWLYYTYEDDNSCLGTDSILVIVSDCLTLNEFDTNNAFVFPNPFSNYTTVHFSTELNENHTLIIYDVLGNEVYRNNKVIGNNLEIKKEQLGVGLYHLALLNSDSEELFMIKLLVE